LSPDGASGHPIDDEDSSECITSVRYLSGHITLSSEVSREPPSPSSAPPVVIRAHAVPSRRRVGTVGTLGVSAACAFAACFAWSAVRPRVLPELGVARLGLMVAPATILAAVLEAVPPAAPAIVNLDDEGDCALRSSTEPRVKSASALQPRGSLVRSPVGPPAPEADVVTIPETRPPEPAEPAPRGLTTGVEF
jgi:hypothetical protein